MEIGGAFKDLNFGAVFESSLLMQTFLSRRRFLARTTAAVSTCALAPLRVSPAATPAGSTSLPFAIVDFHAHLDNSTIDKVLELSATRRVRFGIVEHAGTKENKYPVVLSNDTELKRYLAMLEGKPVYKGVQAEWIDWMTCFSPEALSQLDYVLSDAMTFPAPDGQRMKLWVKEAILGEPQAFMDQYVDWHVQVMAKEPLDILANTTWLPDTLAADYDRLWTPARMKKVIDAAVEYRVALEISSSYRLPKLPFLRMAKVEGAKFSFGSNGRYPKMGQLDYSIAMAQELQLTQVNMFTPAPPGQKPFQRRGLNPS
jgi:histidinol phosphatase-like PHP family hydrolase